MFCFAQFLLPAFLPQTIRVGGSQRRITPLQAVITITRNTNSTTFVNKLSPWWFSET